MTSASQRLREERERIGKSQRAFAELGGVSKNTQLAYESGSSSMTVDYLVRLEEHGVDIGYVTTGNRGIGMARDRRSDFFAGPQDHSPQRGHISSTDIVEVAEVDLRYGLGAAYLDGAIETEPRQFSRAWLRHFTDSPPSELFWARGQGNSMAPDIGDGDIVLIDRREQSPKMADLIWAFAFGEVGMIKWLRPMPDGSVKIISSNPSVPADVAHDDELHIIGRVVAVVKKV